MARTPAAPRPLPSSAAPSVNTASAQDLARARGGLGWFVLLLLVAILSDTGLGWSRFVEGLREAHDALSVMMWVVICLLISLIGEIFGEELGILVWEREERLLRARSDPGAGILQANLMADPFAWMGTVHCWLGRAWQAVPETIRGVLSPWILERVARLFRRVLCLVTGLAGVILMALLFAEFGPTDEVEYISTSTAVLVVLFLVQVFAVGLTSLAPSSLLGSFALLLLYHAFHLWFFSELPLAFLLVSCVLWGFLLLVALRGLRRAYGAPREPSLDS